MIELEIQEVEGEGFAVMREGVPLTISNRSFFPTREDAEQAAVIAKAHINRVAEVMRARDETRAEKGEEPPGPYPEAMTLADATISARVDVPDEKDMAKVIIEGIPEDES